MHVGFHLLYRRSDQAFLALRVARRLLETGCRISILPKETPQAFYPFWDRAAKTRKKDFWNWVKTAGLSHLVFSEPPRPEWVQAAHAAEVRCFLLLLWEELAETDLEGLAELEKVLCPARCVVGLLEDTLALPNAVFLPFEPGVPLTGEGRKPDPPRVYWPIAGSQAFRQEREVLAMLNRVSFRRPETYFTVSYHGKLPADSSREVKRLVEISGERLLFAKNPSVEQESLLYGGHDLTLWPTLVEGLGLAGWWSLSMGAPVMAFDHPVVGEVIKHDSTGLLVPCGLGYNWLGVPEVEPDYEAFEQSLLEVLAGEWTLSRLRASAHRGLLKRREDFNNTIDELFQE